MTSQTTIDSLPNELLLAIVSELPTRELFSLVATNRRFYSATLRILHQRLTRATSLPDHRAILECYHPSAKLSTPTLNCDYLHTDSFFSEDEHDTPEGKAEVPQPSLKDIYCHFRPVVQEENRRPRARYPPSSSSSGVAPSSRKYNLETKPTHEVYLDEDEPFSQLCTVTSVSKLGPKPGLYLSHVKLNDGVIRLKRDWLAAQAQLPAEEPSDILWTDTTKNVGLRFHVAEIDTGLGSRPVLVASEDELPVAYKLEFVELLVRACTLLMTVEKSEKQEIAPEGKAIVIASI